MRAGKVLFGTAACEKGIKRKNVHLLLLQSGLSESSRRHFEILCSRFGVRTITVEEEERLGAAIGRLGIMVAGITDAGLAKTIIKHFDGGSC